MKKVLLLIQLIFLVLSLPVAVKAQGFSDLQKNAKKTIESYNPELKLIRERAEGKRILYQYGPKEHAVLVQIFYGQTRKEVIEYMRSALKILSVGPGQRASGPGDETYTWETKGGGGVRFRRGKVYFDIAAQSLAQAQGLANELAKLVPSR